MPNYAIHDGQKVVNVIIAESKELAEEFTGMQAIITVDFNKNESPSKDMPWVDWTLEQEGWRPPKPFESWVWEGESWIPPIPAPEEVPLGHYVIWNEDNVKWEILEKEQPYPSWIMDENGDWVAPVEYPEDGNPYVWDEENQVWQLIIPEDFI